MAFEHSVMTKWIVIMPGEVCYILMRDFILNSFFIYISKYKKNQMENRNQMNQNESNGKLAEKCSL